MVSHVPQPKPEVMRMHLSPAPVHTRLVPGLSVPPVTGLQVTGPQVPVAPPPWRIEISAADGTPLLTLREENGLLVAEGDESRWDEAAKRFVHGMLQWAGQAGITWKDEARKAGES